MEQYESTDRCRGWVRIATKCNDPTTQRNDATGRYAITDRCRVGTIAVIQPQNAVVQWGVAGQQTDAGDTSGWKTSAMIQLHDAVVQTVRNNRQMPEVRPGGKHVQWSNSTVHQCNGAVRNNRQMPERRPGENKATIQQQNAVMQWGGAKQQTGASLAEAKQQANSHQAQQYTGKDCRPKGNSTAKQWVRTKGGGQICVRVKTVPQSKHKCNKSASTKQDARCAGRTMIQVPPQSQMPDGCPGAEQCSTGNTKQSDECSPCSTWKQMQNSTNAKTGMLHWSGTVVADASTPMQ